MREGPKGPQKLVHGTFFAAILRVAKPSAPSAYERKAIDLQLTIQRNADLYRWTMPSVPFSDQTVYKRNGTTIRISL